MRMLGKALLFATVLLVLAACAPPVQDTAADIAALRADPMAWFEAYNAGNAEGVAALYADDAMVMAPGVPAASGRAAIRDLVAADIEKTKAAGLTLQNVSTTGLGVSGDLGWLSGSYSVVDASGATVDTGNYLSVYRRTNGEWQLIRDIWNSDRSQEPAPTEAPPAS